MIDCNKISFQSGQFCNANKFDKKVKKGKKKM